MDSSAAIWNKIINEIKSQANEFSLNMILNSVSPREIENNIFVLEAVNDVSRQWIDKRYRSLIQKILQNEAPGVDCSIVTKSSSSKISGHHGKPIQLGLSEIVEETPVVVESTRIKPASKTESLFNGKYTFGNFIVGKSNQFAHAICQAVVKNPGALHNPVFIYGGVGLGKTHLMQAIGHDVLSLNPKVKVAYLSSEAFTNEFIDSLKDKKANEFRARYRKKDVLLIDDVQFLAGKEAVVEEFFHTFNELFQKKKQIVMTSDAPPKKINKLEDRLVSRFEMGIIADVQPPDLETRVAILKNSASTVPMNLSDEILMYLAQAITTNIRVLEGAFNRVVAYAGVVQKVVDKDLVDQVLKDFLRENSPGKITIPWIQKRVAEYYDIPEIEMTSKRRAQTLVLPRQIAMRISQMCTEASLAQIGEVFGKRDHTTVMYACDKIATKLKQNREFASEFERVLKYVNPELR